MKNQNTLFLLLILLFDFHLLFAQGSISGTVKNEQGAPLKNVRIRVMNIDGSYEGHFDFTDASGRYQIDSLMVGNYYLRSHNLQGYMDQYYTDVDDKRLAQVFKVLVGSAFSNIDFILKMTGGHVIGRVTDQSTGNPIQNMGLFFFNIETTMDHYTFTDNNGFYRSPGLPAGPYKIMAYGTPHGYLSEYYNDQPDPDRAQIVVISRSDTTHTIDFQMGKGSAIAGQVFAEDDQQPIPNAWIIVYTKSGQWMADAKTKPDGTYNVAGLVQGEFYLKVNGIDAWSFFTEFYDNQSDLSAATPVSVAHNDTTYDIDFYVERVTTKQIENQFVSVVVTDKYNGTNFTMGNTKGLPESKEDDNARLISDYPYPHMSYTTIWLDGVIARFGAAEGQRRKAPQISNDGQAISRSWQWQGIDFTQKVSLVTSDWSPTHYRDTAKLEYVIVNQDATQHSIGLRVLLDTMLGDTDGVPISLPDQPLIFFEREYLANQMPFWWTAINCDTTATGDTVKVYFSAQGTLRDYGATRPDRFAVVRYGQIDEPKYNWNYQINPQLGITHDSAVALWWNPQILAAGDTLRIVTYYGLGKGVPDHEAPKIVAYFPPQKSTAPPNPPLKWIITDNKMGVDTTRIHIWINDQPIKLSFQGALDSLTVSGEFAEALRCNQTIHVRIDPIQDLNEPPNINTVESYFFKIQADQKPPQIVTHSPAKGEYDITADDTLLIVLKDGPAGVERDSLDLWVQNRSVIKKSQITFQDSLVTIKYVGALPANDTVWVQVKAADRAAPANVMPPYTFHFYTFKNDTSPPVVASIIPGDGDTNIPPDTRIRINLRDDISGVDTTTLQMWIDAKLVHPKIDSTIQNLWLTYNLNNDTLFQYNTKVHLELIAQDYFKNQMDRFSSTFTIMPPNYKDVEPPFISEHGPADNERDLPRRTKIWFRIQDLFTGVDTNSVRLTVNNVPVKPHLVAGEPRDYRFEYLPAVPWSFNDSVFVQIQAHDLAAPANPMRTYAFRFYVAADRETPYFTEIYPAPNSRQVPINSRIQLDVLDRQSGVNRNSIKMWLNDQSVPNLEIKGDSAHYQISYFPEQPFDYNQTMQVKVRATDLVAPISNPDSISWTFTTSNDLDTLPPYIRDEKPGRNAENVAPETEISLTIVDEQSGVDPNSIELWISGHQVEPTKDIAPRQVKLNYQPLQPFPYNAHIPLEIKASDFARNPNRIHAQYAFQIQVDTMPPLIANFLPPQDAVVTQSRPQIQFDVFDYQAGVNPTTIQGKINDQPVSVEMDSISPKQFHCRLQYPGNFAAGQNVRVIVAAGDLAKPMNSVQQTYRFQIQSKLPDLAVTKLITIPATNLKMNNPFEIQATIQNFRHAVERPFKVKLMIYKQVLKDTVFTAMAQDQTVVLSTRTQQPVGKYQLKALVDAADEIQESSEINNSEELFVDVYEGRFQVRPNPFTPNADGYNDVAIFNFSELNLTQPVLKIFTIEGAEILTLSETTDNIFHWDGLDKNRSAMPPGIYLYILQDGNHTIARGNLVLAR
ncbi:carboxypeptidase regulatory-like domain-containing protein [candidate division KSB1 bacterium]|nr:carboxypeptidase regulatory-like domain-containing protein [candidate division KSB1 bacterium]